MKLTDYVEPNTGSAGHLLTSVRPSCNYPHGMCTMSLNYDPGVKDFYLAGSVYGVNAGAFTFMAENRDGEYRSRFDHDNEDFRIDSCRVWLEDCLCTLAFTVSERGGVVRFEFDEASEHTLCVRAGELTLENGTLFAQNDGGGFTLYGAARWNDETARTRLNGEYLYITTSRMIFEAYFSMSYIGRDYALKTLEETSAFSFEETVNACRESWETLLGKFRVSGTERNKKIFYTALSRVFSRQNCISEHGKYYSGFDKKVHDDDGHKFYVNDGVWDTHRGAHPLQALTEPEIHADILESFIRQYEQSHWLHDFPSAGGGWPCMLGSHTTTLFADALTHGFPFDLPRAWQAVKFAHNEGSLLPWYIGPETPFDRSYREKGYCPALNVGETETIEQVHSFERRQAVAVTLEQAYDDYAAAKLARAAGDEENAATLEARSYNYKNVFDPSVGFMAPKNSDGEFVRPYDPKMCSAQGGRDYFAECNAWVYTMEVRHDVDGLSALLGGKDKLAERLDRMFVEPFDGDVDKWDWLATFPDSTGLMGQFCMGNEPAFHIPYMYNFCGQPWKTQKILHDICRVWFSPHPLGICGDEDGGAMSAWYVFTAMGFYPFCPGSGYYVIGSPLFDSVSFTLGNGRTFTVLAEGVSGGKKYISGAKLNGKELTRSWFTAQELLEGGTLELMMSKKPCRQWASAPENCPPSRY